MHFCAAPVQPAGSLSLECVGLLEEKQKERTVLQALAGSGKAEDRGTIMPGFVETLKGVRKKYGAQSSEYKTTSGLLNKVRGARTETREEAINEYQAYVKTIGL